MISVLILQFKNNTIIFIFPYFTESIKRVETLTGKSVPVYEVDLLNKQSIMEVFERVKSTLIELLLNDNSLALLMSLLIVTNAQ